MKVYTCPKCGNIMKNTAPNFCPNCGCKSTEFDLTETEETQSEQSENNPSEPKKKGCSFLGCIGIGILIIVIGFIILLLVDSSGSSSGNSTSTQTISNVDKKILAKNCFVDDCIKKNMHDPKSYKEENYVVSYNNANGEYIVTVMFRGNNALGMPVVSTYKGAVKFFDNGSYQCRVISQ